MQKFLYGIGAFVALLVIIGLALPRHARVEVSTTIDARPATVFALVNDFRRAQLWSPRTATDPNARVVFSGPNRGVGATVTWDGVIAGSGTQTITVSRPWAHVETMMNPGEAGEARTWFNIAVQDGGTHLTWGFEHDHGMNLVGRYVAPLLAGVLRREHEQGLTALRELAEMLPRTDFSDLEVEHLVASEQQIAYRATSSVSDPGAISEAMGKAYFEILSFIDQHGLAEAGAPLSISRGFSGADLRFDAAIPVRGVDDDTPHEDGNVRLGATQSGPVIRVKHIGPYRRLGLTHRKVVAYMSAFGLERNGDPWEIYVSDPTKVEESELWTFVYYPVRGL